MIRQEDVKIILKKEEVLKYDRKDYLKFHEELSSKDREITILFQGKPIFDVLVPLCKETFIQKHEKMFAQKLIDLISLSWTLWSKSTSPTSTFTSNHK